MDTLDERLIEEEVRRYPHLYIQSLLEYKDVLLSLGDCPIFRPHPLLTSGGQMEHYNVHAQSFVCGSKLPLLEKL